ncbi:MAG: hypothetical protein ABI818_12125 [Acidobacteriota bacterium]
MFDTAMSGGRRKGFQVAANHVIRAGVAAALLAWVVLIPNAVFAQGEADSAREVTLYELVLRDGSRLYGSIERQDEVEVVFRTQGGATVTSRRVEIASLKEVTGSMVEGEFLPQDPNATRLFFGPTGRSLKKGQAYFGVYDFLVPFVQVGVTDRLSVGAGTPLVFGFNESERPFWVTPKLQLVNAKGMQVSVGVLHAFNFDGHGGGIGYLVGTRGGAQSSFTVGAGVAYGSSGTRSGVLMVGGDRQVRRHLKLITESYVWKGGDGVVSGGIRFFGDRFSADLALAFPVGTGEVFGFPVINFVHVF